MRKKLAALALVLLSSAALAGRYSSPTRANAAEPCQQLPPARPVFEYAHIEGAKGRPAKLNDMGAQGWELVTAFQSDGSMVFVFKRLRQN